jgi:hypothetical protein
MHSPAELHIVTPTNSRVVYDSTHGRKLSSRNAVARRTFRLDQWYRMVRRFRDCLL